MHNCNKELSQICNSCWHICIQNKIIISLCCVGHCLCKGLSFVSIKLTVCYVWWLHHLAAINNTIVNDKGYPILLSRLEILKPRAWPCVWSWQPFNGLWISKIIKSAAFSIQQFKFIQEKKNKTESSLDTV